MTDICTKAGCPIFVQNKVSDICSKARYPIFVQKQDVRYLFKNRMSDI